MPKVNNSSKGVISHDKNYDTVDVVLELISKADDTATHVKGPWHSRCIIVHYLLQLFKMMYLVLRRIFNFMFRCVISNPWVRGLLHLVAFIIILVLFIALGVLLYGIWGLSVDSIEKLLAYMTSFLPIGESDGTTEVTNVVQADEAADIALQMLCTVIKKFQRDGKDITLSVPC